MTILLISDTKQFQQRHASSSRARTRSELHHEAWLHGEHNRGLVAPLMGHRQLEVEVPQEQAYDQLYFHEGERFAQAETRPRVESGVQKLVRLRYLRSSIEWAKQKKSTDNRAVISHSRYCSSSLSFDTTSRRARWKLYLSSGVLFGVASVLRIFEEPRRVKLLRLRPVPSRMSEALVFL